MSTQSADSLSRRLWLVTVGVLCIFAATQLHARVDTRGDGPLSAKKSAKIERRWGIEIVSLRSTAAGGMLDFRYRVVDPQKARLFVDRTQKAFLTDQKSDITMGVPSPSKLGPMRQTLRFGAPPANRVLFMLFANPGQLVQPGDKVTISVGDFRVKNLRVQ